MSKQQLDLLTSLLLSLLRKIIRYESPINIWEAETGKRKGQLEEGGKEQGRRGKERREEVRNDNGERKEEKERMKKKYTVPTNRSTQIPTW